MAAKLEIIRFDSMPDPASGYRVVQLALDGKLCVPLDIYEKQYREMTQERFEAYLRKQAEVAIRTFGDYRRVRRQEDGTYVQYDSGEGGQP